MRKSILTNIRKHLLVFAAFGAVISPMPATLDLNYWNYVEQPGGSLF
jgi:hypothetical protein